MNTVLNRTDLAAIAVRSMNVMVDGDLDDFRAVVHPDAVNRESKDEPLATRGRGPEAYYATALWLREAFSEMAFDVTTTVVEGDLVVAHGTMSGRHTGPFVAWNPEGQVERVFVPTGKPFTVNHAHFLRVSGDKVIEHWAVRDDNRLALQLGWVPPSPLFLIRCALATRQARRAAAREGQG